jgi:hypothetical protein
LVPETGVCDAVQLVSQQLFWAIENEKAKGAIASNRSRLADPAAPSGKRELLLLGELECEPGTIPLGVQEIRRTSPAPVSANLMERCLKARIEICWGSTREET